ncbi:MAG: L-carnitine dehydratase/bile acid-inducible protein, partial [Actinomycetia bacterium]|nr:L-carnitine dehydratase/bile acid-inducible protein [Actinomycetes bacterium]
MASVALDGTPSGRPELDDMQLGWGDRYRLHETADGWLCVALVGDDHLRAFHDVVGSSAMTDRTAAEWFTALDAAGVPCEVSDPDFVLSLFDDPEIIDKGWVTSYDQLLVGKMEVMGLLFDLDDTPGRIQGPPLVPGQDSRKVLADLGYDDERVEKLIATGVVNERE